MPKLNLPKAELDKRKLARMKKEQDYRTNYQRENYKFLNIKFKLRDEQDQLIMSYIESKAPMTKNDVIKNALLLAIEKEGYTK